MSVDAILTQDQASDLNLATSIQQYLKTDVVAPYNAAATSAGLSAGVQTMADGTFGPDTLGLGVMSASPEDAALYERVPTIGYVLDFVGGRPSRAAGAGDMANVETRSVKLCCLPVVRVSADSKSADPQRLAQWILKSAVENAILRKQTTIPIVDHAGSQVGGNYPAVGYAWIDNARIASMERLGDLLDIHRYRFDVMFDLRWYVAAT